MHKQGIRLIFSSILFLYPLYIFSQSDENPVVLGTIPQVSYYLKNNLSNSGTQIIPTNLSINDYLLASIDSGNYQLVSYLLMKGADPNYIEAENSSYFGYFPLLIAAEKGYSKIAELLISKGAKVNNEGYLMGLTPLMCASTYGSLDVVKLLIKNGAEVNHISKDGFTALLKTVTQYNDSIAEILIKNHAYVNICDANNLSPLQYATGYNLLYLKFEGENSFQPDSINYYSKASKVSDLLIKGGAKINAADTYGFTPLMVASQLNNIPLVKLLCTSGANVNAKSTDGISSLMFAADKGYFEIAKTLVQYGADVNSSTPDGNAVLIAAVRANNDSISELLLENKADINIQNNLDLTPLHYAAGYGYPLMTDLLINYGANLDCTDEDGNTPLASSVYSGAYKVSELLINAGADVNKPDKFDNTPVMIASQFNDTTLIRILYQSGAKLDKTNNHKSTALSITIKNNCTDALKMLVNLGARTDDSSQNKSYYQLAYEKGNDDALSFLKSKGVKTSLKPNIGSINFFTGFSASNSDFMFDFGGGIYEPVTRMMVSLGYKYRPISSRVLELRNSEYFQFWEKRYDIYLSLQHLIVLRRQPQKCNIGFAPGISNDFTWSYYRGLGKGSGTKWIIVPSIGLYYQKELFSVIGKWEIANYNKQVKSFNRFNLQFLITIPNYNSIIKNKKIDWLD